MTSIDEIEQSIKPFLLKDITFTLDNKIVKSGKLILFSIKDFFCVFTLTTTDRGNKRFIYEVPYPFTTFNTVSSLEFDYTLNTFCLDNTKITDTVKNITFNRPSKLFNKKLIVIGN
jgi:hypothetical protein